MLRWMKSRMKARAEARRLSRRSSEEAEFRRQVAAAHRSETADAVTVAWPAWMPLTQALDIIVEIGVAQARAVILDRESKPIDLGQFDPDPTAPENERWWGHVTDAPAMGPTETTACSNKVDWSVRVE